MDFGSSHVYLAIKPGGPSIPDIDVSSGIQQDSAGARYVKCNNQQTLFHVCK